MKIHNNYKLYNILKDIYNSIEGLSARTAYKH